MDYDNVSFDALLHRIKGRFADPDSDPPGSGCFGRILIFLSKKRSDSVEIRWQKLYLRFYILIIKRKRKRGCISWGRIRMSLDHRIRIWTLLCGLDPDPDQLHPDPKIWVIKEQGVRICLLEELLCTPLWRMQSALIGLQSKALKRSNNLFFGAKLNFDEKLKLRTVTDMKYFF